MHASLRSLPPRGGNPSNLSKIEEDDVALFEAPSELVCPITHAVFLDPVLTQAGHVGSVHFTKPCILIRIRNCR
jgi:hypothetical protein